jgi:hypothetical protein
MSSKTVKNSTREHVVSAIGIGKSADLCLRSSFALPRVADAWTVCRMAVPRLPMKSLERVVLSLLVEDAYAQQHAADEAGVVCTPYSYAGVGASVGKCAHSVKSAVAALRKAGLLVTSRSARSGETICVSIKPFLTWGASVCARQLSNTTPAADESFGNTEQLPKKERPKSLRKQASKRSAKKTGIDTPKTAEANVAPSATGYDDLGLPPVGPGSDEPFLMEFGPEVDASAEREATLKAAGRSGDEDSDEITFGSDTADSDIGTGIEINMDL